MKSNPEFNAFKDRIRELDDTIVHYEAHEGQLVDRLQRIQAILEEDEC